MKFYCSICKKELWIAPDNGICFDCKQKMPIVETPRVHKGGTKGKTWNLTGVLDIKGKPLMKKCLHCIREFWMIKRGQKFCSVNCRVAHHAEQKKTYDAFTDPSLLE